MALRTAAGSAEVSAMALSLAERLRRQSASHRAGRRSPGMVHTAVTSRPPAVAASPATSDPARTATTISTVLPADFSAGLTAQAST